MGSGMGGITEGRILQNLFCHALFSRAAFPDDMRAGSRRTGEAGGDTCGLQSEMRRALKEVFPSLLYARQPEKKGKAEELSRHTGRKQGCD